MIVHDHLDVLLSVQQFQGDEVLRQYTVAFGQVVFLTGKCDSEVHCALHSRFREKIHFPRYCMMNYGADIDLQTLIREPLVAHEGGSGAIRFGALCRALQCAGEPFERAARGAGGTADRMYSPGAGSHCNQRPRMSIRWNSSFLSIPEATRLGSFGACRRSCKQKRHSLLQ